MQVRILVAVALSSALLAACGGSSNSSRAVPVVPVNNNNGAPATAVITARFDPSGGVLPFPINLLLSGTTDLTLNIPVVDPNNFGDPKVALNALDGFGTVSPWTTSFSTAPKASTLVAGQTVRVFEVTLTGPGGGVTGIVRELQPTADYVVAVVGSDASSRTVAIVPTKPLRQLTSYMAVLTNGITDAAGNDATPDQTYFLTKRTTPLCVGGVSQEPLLPSATACALEPLRQLTGSQEAAAGGAGIAKDKIIVSWVATTQSITPVLQAVRNRTAQTAPATTVVAPTGLNLGSLGAGLPPVADIYIGSIELPYYLGVPSQTNPTAPLTAFWRAAPGAYVPPFASLGLSPQSTFVTFANPFPVVTTAQKVPMVLTIPNANSGRTRPAAGWPIVIYQHGITRDRTDAFAIAATMAAQGYAVVAIDIPLHGITNPANPLFVGNTPLAALGVRERTFNLDLTNNSTGAAGPDGMIDSSGSLFINLSSLLTSRDNIRQASADLFTLARAIPTMRYAGPNDFDGARIGFVGQSLGSIVGTTFMAIEPSVQTAVLNVPGGGIARLLEGSPTFGPRIRAGLLAAGGPTQGTPDYDTFFGAAQTVIDSSDPINFALPANGGMLPSKNLLVQEVVGGGSVPPDQVIPNTVAGAPLSGTEPLIRILGLTSITGTTQSASGIRGAVRFLVGDHGSLLSPAASAAATAEMQGEMASMIVSQGTVVQVANPSVIRQ